MSHGSCATSWTGVSNVQRKRRGVRKKQLAVQRKAHSRSASAPNETRSPENVSALDRLAASQFFFVEVDRAAVARSRRLSHALQCMRCFLSSMILAAVNPSPDLRRFSLAFSRCPVCCWAGYKHSFDKNTGMEKRTPAWKTVPTDRQ